MQTHEQFRVGEILIVGILEMPARSWPSSNRAFAAAIRKVIKTNQFASQFWISKSATGWYSYEFSEILSLMHFATLISYNSQVHDRFFLQVTKRASGILKRRTKATDTELGEVRELLLAHWQEAYGRPWQEEVSEF